MKFEQIEEHLAGIPHMAPTEGKILYDFILEKQPKECLELGTAHGVSSCYVAAALHELGKGKVTTVDLNAGQEWQNPCIEDLLDKTGLHEFVSVHREHTSYTWFLKKKLEENVINPARYDFCFIDGPKNWTVDSAAFFLVDKLLRQDGWILFDDLNWKYANASEWSTNKLTETGIMVNRMGQDELDTPHVDLIFRLLVMTHPDYSEFQIQGNWAWAHKINSPERTLVVKETRSLVTQFKGTLRRITSL